MSGMTEGSNSRRHCKIAVFHTNLRFFFHACPSRPRCLFPGPLPVTMIYKVGQGSKPTYPALGIRASLSTGFSQGLMNPFLAAIAQPSILALFSFSLARPTSQQVQPDHPACRRRRRFGSRPAVAWWARGEGGRGRRAEEMLPESCWWKENYCAVLRQARFHVPWIVSIGLNYQVRKPIRRSMKKSG